MKEMERTEGIHKPVLVEEVLEILDPKAGGVYVDATVNGGGHARAILARGPGVKVLGIDRDPALIEMLESQKLRGLELACGNYADLRRLAGEKGIEAADGVLFDLGFSSWHVERSGRGFSFQNDEPLDMRYDPYGGSPSASDLVNRLSEEELADLIRYFGEERYSRRIARSIVEEREKQKFSRTGELVRAVERALPPASRRPGIHGRNRIHPATRTFQALRIAVNRELDNLATGLKEAAQFLRGGGVLAAISFHSLEDRAVKQFMKAGAAQGNFSLITKKPVRPGASETAENPRSRSAKLRAMRKI